MLVAGERIEQVGKRDEIERLAEARGAECEVVDAGGRVVLPGFVDAHTHPVFGGNRAGEFEQRSQGVTYQEIAAAGGGIQATVRMTREASAEQLTQAGKRYADWFLRNGTTTVEAKSGYGLTLEDELKILRAIKQLDANTLLRLCAHVSRRTRYSTEFKSHRDEYVELLVEEMIPAVATEKLAEYCDVFAKKRCSRWRNRGKSFQRRDSMASAYVCMQINSRFPEVRNSRPSLAR